MQYLTIVALLVACARPIAGTRTTPSATVGPAIATARASDAGGIRVLANGSAGRGDAGLLATSQAELEALWSDVGLERSPPRVDFATHVVLGTNFEDGVCQPELVAAHVDAHGALTFEEQHTADACILLAVRVARVVAVPRSILPARFTWRARGSVAFAFELPARAAASASAPPPAPAPMHIARPRGVLALPAAGHIALRALDDGRQVWIARRAADDITVLHADLRPERGELRVGVGWSDKTHRFSSEHDSRGRSIHGRASLEVLAFERRDGDRIAVGDPIDPGDGPLVARDQEPALDGPATPYEGVAPTTFAALAEGRVGVVAGDLVSGLSGPPRLCTLPAGKLRNFLRGCPDTAPALAGAAARSRSGIGAIHGPLVVRRAGANIDLAIAIGGGSSGWAVEHQLAPPARRGPTHARGRVVVGQRVEGLTTRRADGFAPSCLPAAAQGSPDESWDLEASAPGTYLVEVTSKYDATVAVVDRAGAERACNDDAKGFYRRSLVQVVLAAGTHRIVVDGFGGQAGAYALTVHATTPLPPLAVGRPVQGDTTRAIDQEAHGCYAPAGDHRYTLAIDQPGLYAFRIDTPGWAPMISVLREPDGYGCSTHAPPLVQVERLEPGTYYVVIDGASERQRGPYTLTVERCASDDAKACRAAH